MKDDLTPAAPPPWINDAPRRHHCVVAAAMVAVDTEVHRPAVAFQFAMPVEFPPLSVLLVGTRDTLRAFQRELDRAVTQAIRLDEGRTARRRK